MDADQLNRFFATMTPCQAQRAQGMTPTVVFLLFFRPEDWHILMIQKTNTEGYPWANQVALPGGHVDRSDASPLAAAFRELAEETGIQSAEIDFFGSIGHFPTIANKDIEGFAGFWKHPRPLQVCAAEIARVLELPVREALRTHRECGFSGRRPPVDELAYPVEDTRIWGATARIIQCVCEHLLAHEDS
jgi:8-oxo-dGTP pyrophosphatase MutT (NUDIX family)